MQFIFYIELSFKHHYNKNKKITNKTEYQTECEKKWYNKVIQNNNEWMHELKFNQIQRCKIETDSVIMMMNIIVSCNVTNEINNKDQKIYKTTNWGERGLMNFLRKLSL